MSLQIELKKSAVSQKQPFASDLAVGELALNYNADGPFLTCKDSAGNVRKLNHVWVGTTAPTNPTAGDQWLDTSATTAVLKLYKDSSSTWVNATTVPVATTSIYGTVQLATAADVSNGTSGKIIDAAQLQSKITDLLTNDVTLNGDLDINGDLTVTGTTTTIDTVNLIVEDKNIEMGSVDTPTDTTADGGGITLKGATDKTLNWVNATDSWTSSENVDLASGKSYRINGTEVLSATTLGSAVQISSANIPNGTIVDSDINAAAEIAVSKLQDGAARQLLQTDAAGTGVEWTSNVDVPGTLDVTGAATFDSSVAVTGTLTKSGSNVVTVGDTGTITSPMILDGTIVNADVNASAAIAGTKISPDFGSQNVATTGTATAAALIPSGSSVPTNGVYLPSANNVAISTNSTGRLFVDASGNVGVATASPGAALDVAGNIRAISAAPIIYINNTSSQYAIKNSSDSFTIEKDGNERLRITSDGKVGLGTSSPGKRLNILSSSQYDGLLVSNSTQSIAELIGFSGTNDNGALVLRNSGTANVQVLASGTSYFNGGNVGIGTTSPAFALDVAGTIVSTDANLGLRTALTNGLLQAREFGGSSANNTLEFNIRANSGKSGYLTFTETTVADRWSIGIQNGSDGLRFISGTPATGTERCRIDGSGRLLVGTSTARSNFFNTASSAPQQFQVEGTTGNACSLASICSVADTSGGRLLLAHQRSGGVGGNTILNSGDQAGYITFQGNDGGEFVECASIEAIIDGTPGANDMPGRLVFSTTADGASSPTERMRIDSAGLVTISGSIKDPSITGTILEDVYTITDGAAFEVDPGNGSVQLITLGANRTPLATNFAAGEAVTLMIDDGTAYTLTWTDTTWGTSGVVWTGGSAPTLATSGYTVVQFWKVGTQVYGAYVGDVA